MYELHYEGKKIPYINLKLKKQKQCEINQQRNKTNSHVIILIKL